MRQYNRNITGRQLDAVEFFEYNADVVVTLYQFGIEIEVQCHANRERIEEWCSFQAYPELESCYSVDGLLWNECADLVDGMLPSLWKVCS